MIDIIIRTNEAIQPTPARDKSHALIRDGVLLATGSREVMERVRRNAMPGAEVVAVVEHRGEAA